MKAVLRSGEQIDTLKHIVHFVDSAIGTPPQTRRTQSMPQSLKVNVYPNPTSNNIISVLLSEQPEENFKLDVLSVDGKRVFSGEITDVLTTVNVDNFSNGIYIFKVTGKNLHETIRVAVAK